MIPPNSLLHCTNVISSVPCCTLMKRLEMSRSSSCCGCCHTQFMPARTPLATDTSAVMPGAKSRSLLPLGGDWKKSTSSPSCNNSENEAASRVNRRGSKLELQEQHLAALLQQSSSWE